jgi:uncharacterized protein (TIGR03085 family)
VTLPAVAERRALADLMVRLGPSAPTLCEGWTTADLAAHLVIRDRRPDAALGIVVASLAGYTEKVQRATRDKQSYEELVGRVRNGPPALSPLRIPALDAAANTLEYFVHHEDVRRAQPEWTPRTLEAGLADALWAGLGRIARVALRKLPVGTVLVSPGHGELRAGPAPQVVTVTGDPGELVLFAFGRLSSSQATFEGPPDAVARVKAADLGL